MFGLVVAGVVVPGEQATAGVQAGDAVPAASCGPREGVGTAGGLESSLAATDVVGAEALAAACDEAVEVLSERTPWQTLHANPDGTMTLHTSAGALRTQVSGEWEPIDNDVVQVADELRVVSPAVPMVFSDGTDDAPLATVERDGHVLTFDVPFDLTPPAVSGPRITYSDVLPGVDLVVTVNEDATGFAEVLRVESAEAAAHPDLAALHLPVVVSDGLTLEEHRSGFVAREPDGEVVFRSPAPLMWDSSTPRVAATTPRVSGGLTTLRVDAAGSAGAPTDRTVAPLPADDVAVMPVDLGDDVATIVPDAAMLADPATVWPVYIDPSISGSVHQWTAVRDGLSPNYRFNPDEGTGRCEPTRSSECSKNFRSRLMWQFAGLEQIGALDPSDIVSATFAAVGTHSYDCTPRNVELWRVVDFDSGTTWPGGPLWELLSRQTVAHKPACAGQPVRWIEWDATAQARAIADAGTAVGSFGLSPDDSSMLFWKRYRYDAGFGITFNRAPRPATNVRITNPDAPCASGTSRPFIRSTQPILRGTITDPDGGNVSAHFIIDRLSGGVAWDSGLTPMKASGSEHAVLVPAGALQNGTTYKWRIGSRDPGNRGGTAVHCEFTVDTSPPAEPAVAPVSEQPAVYVEDRVAGGIGVTGRFALSTSSTDVVAYRYSVNNSGLGSTVKGATATIAVTPTTVGSTSLYVVAVDRAGNVSTTRHYRFSVGFPGRAGAWSLDEPTGETAASEVDEMATRFTLSGTPTRVPGPLALYGIDPADLALAFDGADDQAVTPGPVVATDASYSVAATVRVDAVPSSLSGTAVSQDGRSVSGFALGHKACADGDGACWSFAVNGRDGSGSPVLVVSDTKVQTGSWVQLTGTHNLTTGRLQLWVCALEGDQVPVATAAVAYTATWNAVGPFRLGSSLGAQSWAGAIGEVRAYTGVVDVMQIRAACNPA